MALVDMLSNDIRLVLETGLFLFVYGDRSKLNDVNEKEEVGTGGVFLLLGGDGGVRKLPCLSLVLLLLHLVLWQHR